MARRRLIRIPAAAAAAATLVATGWGTASAAGPVLVSGKTSPYNTKGCLDLDQTQLFSRNYLDSEVEPQVAIDPTNPSHLVGAYQQDRWSNGGSHGLVAAYSTNGGAFWTVSPQPFSVCYRLSGYPGPYLNYQRASDPWVSIGPGAPAGTGGTSTVYSDSISFDQTSYSYAGVSDPNALRNAVGAAVSYDGGATWAHVQTIIADPCVQGSSGPPGYVCNSDKAYVFNDKNSITADPLHAGVAYAIWDRLVAPPANPSTGREHAYFGQTYLSKTTDFGRTWSTPRTITGLASQDQTIGNQIVVDRQSGALYDFFNLIQNASNSGGNRGYNVAFIKSTDQGATWTRPQVVAALETVGVSDPNNRNPYTNAPPAPSRTGDIIPEPAINPITSQLYVVWQDARWNDFKNDEVAIATSSDGGATWSAPERANVHTGQPAYDPSVYVKADPVHPAGVVGVSYFQWGPTVSGNEPTTLFLRQSTSTGSSSAAPGFTAAPSSIDGPFNNLAAPVARGYFLGDYQGLVANASGFIPFYVTTTCSAGGPTTQPPCRAIQSVLNPTDRTPTGNNSTDVYAAPNS